jgi:class 3 adenylate cyclase
VRAGLSIVSELERVNQRLESEQGVRLGVRIGIHTGDVVMGETGSGKDRGIVAWGHTVNLADRLQKATEPDSVAISRETARLVHGLFVMRDLGALSLEGIARVLATCLAG